MAEGDVPELAMLYLQTFTTLIISCYLLRDWSRLVYRTHRKQKERPGLLTLNWSLQGLAQVEKDEKEKIRSAFLDRGGGKTKEGESGDHEEGTL